MSNTEISFKAEILSGDYKGRIVKGIQNIDNFSPYVSRQVEVRDKVLLTHDTGEDLDMSKGFLHF